MNKKRTGGMTTIAILNFIFGGAGVWGGLFALMTANSLISNPMLALGGKGSELGMLLLVAALLSLTSAGAAIVSGIGILKLAPWGRTWTLVYAILGIVVPLIGLLLTPTMQELNPNEHQASHPVLSLIIGCIYPVILLFLISTTRWKETFSSNAVQVA